MLDSEVVLPVIGQRLVEGRVLILRDLLWVAHPDGFLLVDQSPLMADLLDLESDQISLSICCKWTDGVTAARMQRSVVLRISEQMLGRSKWCVMQQF